MRNKIKTRVKTNQTIHYFFKARLQKTTIEKQPHLSAVCLNGPGHCLLPRCSGIKSYALFSKKDRIFFGGTLRGHRTFFLRDLHMS